MRLSLPLSPLMPIFDVERRNGSIEIGNTPPGGSTPVYPAYDTLVLSLGPTRYYPASDALSPSSTAYDFLLAAFGPRLLFDDNLGSATVTPYDTHVVGLSPMRYYPAGDLAPATGVPAYDTLVQSLNPVRYYPASELNP